MKLIVGLGNPGKKYELTRHNVGFRVVEEILQDKRLKMKDKRHDLKMINDKKFKAEIGWLDKDTLLVKPQTFMNNSGKSIKLLTSHFSLPISNLWVIHDDLDLELGRIKIQKGGQAAGHHGIESIIKEIGSPDFIRFRLGIGRLAISTPVNQLSSKTVNSRTVEYVLDTFNKKEEKIIEAAIKRMAQAVLFSLKEGIEKAMNKYN